MQNQMMIARLLLIIGLNVIWVFYLEAVEGPPIVEAQSRVAFSILYAMEAIQATTKSLVANWQLTLAHICIIVPVTINVIWLLNTIY